MTLRTDGPIGRLRPLAALLALVGVLTAQPALAGCDLSRVIGYTLVGIKPIDFYMDSGLMKPGFAGCMPNRVIVFADHSGLRCAEARPRHVAHPVGYLFARSNVDMKLCVGDDLYKVTPTN